MTKDLISKKIFSRQTKLVFSFPCTGMGFSIFSVLLIKKKKKTLVSLYFFTEAKADSKY